jgi:hypothetical protein
MVEGKKEPSTIILRLMIKARDVVEPRLMSDFPIQPSVGDLMIKRRQIRDLVDASMCHFPGTQEHSIQTASFHIGILGLTRPWPGKGVHQQQAMPRAQL